jgi:hypothetical protein
MTADTPRFTVEEVDTVAAPRRAHVDDIPEPKDEPEAPRQRENRRARE